MRMGSSYLVLTLSRLCRELLRLEEEFDEDPNAVLEESEAEASESLGILAGAAAADPKDQAPVTS